MTKRAGGIFPAILIAPVFYVIAVWLWRSTGSIFYLFNFVYIGTAIGVGIVLMARLPRERHGFARRVTQFLIGLYLLGFGPRINDALRSLTEQFANQLRNQVQVQLLPATVQ